MPTSSDWKDLIELIFRIAGSAGLSHIDLSAKKLHEALWGYPGHDHRMNALSNVMHALMGAGDIVLSAPAKGNGPSLTVRYHLRR